MPISESGANGSTATVNTTGTKPGTGELTEPAAGKLFLKISDPAGRAVFEKQAEAGSKRQTILAERLPPGLYFLQVVSEGKLLAVEKFVKE